VRITLEVGNVSGDKKAAVSSYQLVTTTDVQGTLVVSNRVPVRSAVTSSESNGVKQEPASSVTYQTVGVNVSLIASVLEVGRIRLKGTLEASVVRDGSKSGFQLPIMATLSQTFDVVAQDGLTLRVASNDESGIGTFFVDIRPDILRSERARQ
jgi:hypothetical protein